METQIYDPPNRSKTSAIPCWGTPSPSSPHLRPWASPQPGVILDPQPTAKLPWELWAPMYRQGNVLAESYTQPAREGGKSRIKHLSWDQSSQGLHPSTSGSITTLPAQDRSEIQRFIGVTALIQGGKEYWCELKQQYHKTLHREARYTQQNSLFIHICATDAIWEEIWSNVFVNMNWVITG